jgi:hypothetical protein
MPRGNGKHGGARPVRSPADKRISNPGRPPAKAELRAGTEVGVSFDGVMIISGEVYDVERMDDRRVVRWRSEDGQTVLVLYI